MIFPDKKHSANILSSIIADWQSCQYSQPVYPKNMHLSEEMTSKGLYYLYCCKHIKVISNAPEKMRIQISQQDPSRDKSKLDLVKLCTPFFPPNTIVSDEQLRQFLEQVESSLHMCQNCVYYALKES
ncbi:MAG: hypothetical protein A2006_15185 [Ignavibacteria bacterium GWC2_35_8]|nr:MAG: hypothetical protein A2006_15185 [Ignavibacteria bacterium GWC2_35_8]